MVKKSSEKVNLKSINQNRILENNNCDSQNCPEGKVNKKYKSKENSPLLVESAKRESILAERELASIDQSNEVMSEIGNGSNVEKGSKSKMKKYVSKLNKDADDKVQEVQPIFNPSRLSHSVIVSSVLRTNSINVNIDAILPAFLHEFYKNFLNNTKHIEKLQEKDEFFYGVGLLGVGMEDKIFNKRKTLEESLKRGFRLRPNPKPTKLFDGTVINRPQRTQGYIKYLSSSSSRPLVMRNKSQFNVFNIGNKLLNKRTRKPVRKTIRKKIFVPRPVNPKPKRELNPESASSGEETDDINSKSIALTRPKRQLKVPQLDFRFCYGDGGSSRFKRSTEEEIDITKQQSESQENSSDNPPELIDSDSSSVVEVSPPNDERLSDSSDTEYPCVRRGIISPRDFDKSKKLKLPNSRRIWRQENRALNLLDKLRLGLQCTIIQTEKDIIIQNLSLDDLATLQSRLQGLATFKNIEAEYDKNGQETARATIDRKVLNLPLKCGESNFDSNRNFTTYRRTEDILKRKLTIFNPDRYQPDRKKLNIFEKSEELKMQKIANPKQDDVSSAWIRPKCRSIKKVRKLYTQSGSTPNILSRSQITQRTDGLISSSRSNSTNAQSFSSTKPQALPFTQSAAVGSIIASESSSTSHPTFASVAFYPQMNAAPAPSVQMLPEQSDTKLPSVKEIQQQLSSPSSSLPDNTTCQSTEANNVISIAKSTTLPEPAVPTVSSTHSTVLDFVKKQQVTTVEVPAPPLVSQTKLTDLVCPATAMSASQLLMMRRGGGGQTSSESTIPCSSAVTIATSDHIFSNQILKPFKKSFAVSSPPKLELDDEDGETDFELTPSIITQSKNVPGPAAVSLTSSPVVAVQNKTTIFSKPLIQSSGVRRTIQLANTPLFQAQNAQHNLSTNQIPINNHNVSAPTKVVPIIDKTAAAAINVVVSSNSNSNSVIQNPLPPLSVSSSNIKIKHRKWTHNFFTSNTINFREMLCPPPPPTTARKIPQQQQPSTIANSVVSVTNVNSVTVKPITISSVIPTNSINNIIHKTTPDKLLMSSTTNQTQQTTPSKGSSVVLKSLLVGSTSNSDLCNSLNNKVSNWASKYLGATSSMKDSKIKWQVGGTIVASQPNFHLSPSSSLENNSSSKDNNNIKPLSSDTLSSNSQ